MTRPRTTVLRTALAVALLQFGTSFVLAHAPPTLGESLPLRWLRTAEDHPVRTPAALLCLLLALRLRRDRQDPAPGEAPEASIRYHGASPSPIEADPRPAGARDPRIRS